MVNIIDCLRNVVTDRYAMIKIFILTIPVIVIYYMVMSGQGVLSEIVNFVFGIVFAAVFFETIRRSCNAEPMLLPSFLMPLRMFLTLGLTIVSAIPSIIVCIGIYVGYIQLLKIYPQIMSNNITFHIVNFICSLIVMSVFFAGITQYLDSGKVLDSYNPMKILKALKTFIVNFFFYFIQDFILVLVIMVIPALGIFIIGGKNPNNIFMIIYLCMAMILNYLVFADYIGQTKKDSESPYERLF